MEKYNRVMGKKDVIVLAFGAMIGWGWVVSSGAWINDAGVIGTILGFIVGGAMIYFVGLTYAELATAIPVNGGAQEFSKRAFGSGCSFVCTWFLILSYLGVVCFEACSFPTIIQYLFPNISKGYVYTIAGFDVYASWLLIAAITTVFITVINIYGIKLAAKIQTIFTVAIALVGVMLFVASILNGSAKNLEEQFVVGEGIDCIQGIFSIAVIAPFYLFGFDVIPQASEEINVPRKRLGTLMVLSIVLAIVFYSIVVFAVGYAMNSNEIHKSLSASGLVTADAMEKVFSSSQMAKILIFGGLCGIITSWNSFLIGGSRTMAALACSGFIPVVFGKLHEKYKTPYVSIVVLGLLSFLSLFFGRVMLTWISNVASFACCVAYSIVAASFIRLRKAQPQIARPYRVKHYKLVGYTALIMSSVLATMYLIPGTKCSFTIQEKMIFIVWITIGGILLKVNKSPRGE